MGNNKAEIVVERRNNQLHTTVVLAMSADGKIADFNQQAARFSSPIDKAHLEQRIAAADGVLFGAGTLRAYGTTLGVSNPQLLQCRKQHSFAPQPVQIVVSHEAKIDSRLPFFRQRLPRWLLTTHAGAKLWEGRSEFERIIVIETLAATESDKVQADDPRFSFRANLDWKQAWQELSNVGLKRLAVLGGGQLVASLLAFDLIDEFWLTVCPLILGGIKAPTPVEGAGFLQGAGPRLELLSAEVIEQEVFLHYCLRRQTA